jgi:ubiquinol-cytochrome c reductase iron-sulfur subunit
VTVTLDRRRLLYATTAGVGAVGLAAAAWPFIAHLGPDAGVRFAGDVIDIDISNLAPAQPRIMLWHGRPIVVVRRTPEMLEAMQETRFVARLVDASSTRRQQPPYAANWHRSIDPALAVLVDVCTYCGCKPRFITDAFPPDVVGGYECPCCASHFDPAGRAHAGPAQYNLPVPPYEIAAPTRIVLGRNRSDIFFSLDSVERI